MEFSSEHCVTDGLWWPTTHQGARSALAGALAGR